MKKINFNRALVAKKKLFLFLLPVLLLAGCKPGEENKPAAAGLQIEPKLITCPATGGDYTIDVSSPDGEWTATSSASWIRVMPASGEKGTTEVRVKIDTNKEAEESQGKITFVSGEEKVEMPVSRAAKDAPYLRVVSEKELNTPKEGGTYTVQVESNIKWSISSNTGWAKVNKGVSVNNDNITVTVSPATTPEETTATITIAPYGEGEAAGIQQVTITRGSTEATSLSVDPTEITAPENGGSFTVNVSSNAKWRVWKTWDMDWLKFSGSQDGDGNGSFSFSIEEATSMDDVSGILTIEEDRSDNYKPVVTQVAVSRKGKAAADLTVAPIAINAPAEGGHFPVAIKSNYPWTATTSGNFFSLSSTSGDGYSTIVVSVNPATDERENTGYIIIRTSFGGEQARINIKREGYIAPEPEIIPALQIYPTQISSPAEGGEYTINVTSNCNWTVTSYDESVANVYPNSGFGSGSFKVTVQPSLPKVTLRGYISVATEDQSISERITVTREKYKTQLAQKPFSIEKNKQVYFSPGNLLYTQSSGVWSFAEYQHDSYGLAGGIWELFGWGTGNDPTATTVSFADFESLIHWGINPITYQNTTYPANTWYVLTGDHWTYLLNKRANAAQLKGAATVNGTKGYVLLPDSWQQPSSLTFMSNTNNYAANVYTAEEWIKMEAEGAIFLPASGYRYNYALAETNQAGHYWTTSIEQESAGVGSAYVYAEYLHFYYNSSTDNGCAVEYKNHKFSHGCAARLVRNAE